MSYRRYGYKAPQGKEGGAHDNYAIFRFLVFVFSFIMFMLSYVYSTDLLIGHYFFSGLLFLLVGFIQEFLSKLENIPVLVTALFLMMFADKYQEIWFTCKVNYVDEQGYLKSEFKFVVETYYIYLFYNILLVCLSFIDNGNSNSRARA